MKKLHALRSHLLSIPDELRIEPEALHTFADAGKVISASGGTNQHFEFQYTANVIVENFSGNPLQLFFWLLTWLHKAQPNHAPDAVNWQADQLNEQSADIGITFALTETIHVGQEGDDFTLIAADEPNLVPEPLTVETWDVTLNGEDISEWLNDDNDAA